MILIVVESEVLRQRLMEMLSEMGGWAVVCVNKVQEAVRHLKENDFAMIITDMRLSDGTGFDVIAGLPQTGTRPKIVMLMPYLLTPYTMEAKKRGVDLVLEYGRLLQGWESLSALMRPHTQSQGGAPQGPSAEIFETPAESLPSAVNGDEGSQGLGQENKRVL